MLSLPSMDTPLRVMGIDPGTDHLGISLLTYSYPLNRIAVEYSHSLCATKEMRFTDAYELMSMSHGDRLSRLEYLSDQLLRIMHSLRPDTIVVETPFATPHRIESFKALVEVLTYIHKVMYKYNPLIEFIGVAPQQARAPLGLSYKSVTKEDILVKILEIIKDKELIYQHTTPIELLTDHAIDSMVVAYFHCLYWRDTLKCGLRY